MSDIPRSAEGTGLGKALALGFWLRFIKFNVVGLIGVFVNEGALIALAVSGVYYLYASAAAIELAILSNFVLNDFWTFRDRRHGRLAVRLLRFNGLMFVGLAANLVILYAGTAFLGINYAISNLIGIGGAFLVRYWLSVRYAWIKEVEEPPRTGLGPV